MKISATTVYFRAVAVALLCMAVLVATAQVLNEDDMVEWHSERHQGEAKGELNNARPLRIQLSDGRSLIAQGRSLGCYRP